MAVERPMEFNNLDFNDRSKSDLNVSPYYWINVTSVDGLFGNDIRFETHDIAGSMGSRSAKPIQSGKQLVLTGEVWGQNLRKLREGEWALQEAFWTALPLPFYFAPWPIYETGNDRLYFTVFVNQPLVITDTLASGPNYKQNWVVGLHADDPRPYKESDDALYFDWQ